MTGEHPSRGLPRRNARTDIRDAQHAVQDTPDQRAIRAAHAFGTVWVRYDAATAQWQLAKYWPDAQADMDTTGAWHEERVYQPRLDTLLRESEFSVCPLGDHPLDAAGV